MLGMVLGSEISDIKDRGTISALRAESNIFQKS